MISRGKSPCSFAALASIAALLEHSYDVLYDDAVVAQYVQVGLLCVSYFCGGLAGAYRLAKLRRGQPATGGNAAATIWPVCPRRTVW